MLVERHQAPLVSVQLLLDTAYAADFAQTKAGTGDLAVSLLDEGTTTRDSLDAGGRTGAPRRRGERGRRRRAVDGVAVRAQADARSGARDLRRRRPQSRLPPGGRRPRQGAAGGGDPRAAAAAGVDRQPRAVARHLRTRRIRSGGQATEASVTSITRDDLVALPRALVPPDNAMLLVVGDTTLARAHAEAGNGARRLARVRAGDAADHGPCRRRSDHARSSTWSIVRARRSRTSSRACRPRRATRAATRSS